MIKAESALLHSAQEMYSQSLQKYRHWGRVEMAQEIQKHCSLFALDLEKGAGITGAAFNRIRKLLGFETITEIKERKKEEGKLSIHLFHCFIC